MNVFATFVRLVLGISSCGFLMCAVGVMLMNGQCACRHVLDILECISGMVRWCEVGEMDTIVLLQWWCTRFQWCMNGRPNNISNCELVTSAWHVNSSVMYCLVCVYAGMFNVIRGAIVVTLDCCELAP